LFLLSRCRFYAPHNRLTRVPRELLQVSHLTHLSLAYCQIDCIPDQISNLRSLSGLYLQHNRITRLPVTPLLALEALCELYLQGNPLPSELAKNCKKKTKVEMVVLEAAGLYQRHHACAHSVVTLLAVRRFGRDEPDLPPHVARLLHFCPRELFAYIGRLLLSSRSDGSWAGEIRQSTRLFRKRHRQ
jgi:hypothetical protein